MSHSRIFQISKTPLDKDDLMHDCHYDECIPNTMDYVLASNNIQGDLKWLQETYGKYIKVNTRRKTITIRHINQFKAERLRTITKLAKELAEAAALAAYNIESGYTDAYDGTYAHSGTNLAAGEHRSIDTLIYLINTADSDKYGFYIDDNNDYWGLMPLNEWLSDLKNGDTFYIGKIFDYHM